MKKVLLIASLAVTMVYCNTPRPATTPDTTNPTGTATGTTDTATGGGTTDTTRQLR